MTFQIVKENFLVYTDEMVGRDILERFQCKIDFETLTIMFNTENEDVIIPMRTKPLMENISIPAERKQLCPLNYQEQKIDHME